MPIDSLEGECAKEMKCIFIEIPRFHDRLYVSSLDVYQIKGSAVVVLAVCEKKSGEEVNVKQIIETFRKIIPIIAKVADKAVLVVVTQPIDVMSYVVWKLSKLPSGRVLGTGTLLNSSRLQDLLSQKLGMARTSVSCISIGAQGDSSGTWMVSWLISWFTVNKNLLLLSLIRFSLKLYLTVPSASERCNCTTLYFYIV